MIDLEERTQILTSLQLDSLTHSSSKNITHLTLTKTVLNDTKNSAISMLNLWFCALYYQRIGNTLVFWVNSFASPLCLVGPHCTNSTYNITSIGMLFCLSLPGINIGLSLYYMKFLSFFVTFCWKILFFAIVGLLQIVFLANFLINPGIVLNRESQGQKGSHCSKCFAFIKDDAKVLHCPMCDVCIENPDHHCGVIGKCIGKRSIAYFYALILNMIFLYAYLFGSLLCFLYLKK